MLSRREVLLTHTMRVSIKYCIQCVWNACVMSAGGDGKDR